MSDNKYLLRGFLLLLVFALANPSSILLSASEEEVVIVYLVTNDTSDYSIHWLRLGTTTNQSVTITDAVTATALPPVGRHMAYATRTGNIRILDLTDGQEVSMSVRLDVDLIFPWDTQFDRSKSLEWSPDGRRLAFVGLTAPDTYSVYVYNVIDSKLTQLAPSLSAKHIASPAWSPDSNQLAFLAAWDNQNLFEPVVVSLEDTSAYRRIAPNQATCRLYWSPDSQHIASAPTCYYGPQQNPSTLDLPGLLVFNATSPEDVITAPVIEPGTYSWGYSTPHWITDHQLVGVQGFDYTDTTPSQEVVEYSLITNELTPLKGLSSAMEGFVSTDRQEDWELWYTNGMSSGRYAYNPITEQFLDLTGVYECVTVTISPNGDYLGIPSGCDLSRSSAFHVYSLITEQNVLVLETQSTEAITPLGFVNIEG
jgi:dipeptidyl aminopeptidase/acylaminoacyl peptidase